MVGGSVLTSHAADWPVPPTKVWIVKVLGFLCRQSVGKALRSEAAGLGLRARAVVSVQLVTEQKKKSLSAGGHHGLVWCGLRQIWSVRVCTCECVWEQEVGMPVEHGTRSW